MSDNCSKLSQLRSTRFLKKVLGLFVGISLSALSAHSYYNLSGFWRLNATGLTFSPTSQSGTNEQCLSATVSRSSTSAAMTVNLSGGGATFFSDSGCSTAITSFSLVIGASSQVIYFTFPSPGAQVITASATGAISGHQIDTITLNPFTWVGGGANANWTTLLNWSGHAVPTSTDTAIFDGNCSSNCSANLVADTAVGGIGVYPGYIGAVSMNGHNITNFTNFYISGGIFDAGSGTLNVYSFVSAGGTFNAGTSTVVFEDAYDYYNFPITATLYNLTVGAAAGSVMYLSGSVNVTHNLLFNMSANGIYGGTIVLNGSVAQTVTDSYAGTGGSLNTSLTLANSGGGITFNSALQIIQVVAIQSGTASISGGNNVTFGNFELNSGATFTSTTGNLTVYTSNFQVGSTFNANGGTVTIGDNGVETFSSSPTFNHLTLGNDSGSPLTLTGTANVKGNLVYHVPAAGYGVYGGGIVMNGSTAQTVTDFYAGAGGYLSNTLTFQNTSGGVTINSALIQGAATTVHSGTVSIAGASNVTLGTFELDTGATFTSSTGTLTLVGALFQSGSTFNANSGTVIFSDNYSAYDCTGFTPQFHNLVIGNGSNGYVYFSGAVNVNGNLSITVTPAGGIVDNATVGMNGTSAQTVTNANAGTFMAMSITAANSSGGVTLSSAMTLNGGFTLQSGTAQMTGSHILAFTGTFAVNSGAHFTCNGECGAGTACGQGSNLLQCGTYSDAGTITP